MKESPKGSKIPRESVLSVYECVEQHNDFRVFDLITAAKRLNCLTWVKIVINKESKVQCELN